jgi:hypothetical protein
MSGCLTDLSIRFDGADIGAVERHAFDSQTEPCVSGWLGPSAAGLSACGLGQRRRRRVSFVGFTKASGASTCER